MSGILVLAMGLAWGPVAQQNAKPHAHIKLDELKAHVYQLASPDFKGRSGAGAARTARYLADAFESFKLEPAFGSSYYQPIPWRLADDPYSFVGRNVGGMIPGRDPKLKDEWIMLSAHFDHLGESDGHLYPGADDNATGVAMLLALAKHFAQQTEKPRRTILFVAFDLEEAGLQGSTHFATHPPRDIRKLKAFLTADMLGRSMANVMDEYVFALGSESSPQLRKLLCEVAPPRGLKVGRLGADIAGTRSDYGPFRDRCVPFLFFSTGQHPDYHRPTDTPEKIDYGKLRRITIWIGRLLERLAADDAAPAWEDKGLSPDLEEARIVFLLLQRVLTRQEDFPLTAGQRELVGGIEKRLGDILDRKRITSEERKWLVWTARLLLATVFMKGSGQ